jgi:hypothetical protein
MLRAIDNAAKSFGITLRDAPSHNDAEIESVMAAVAQEVAAGCSL